jgi:hypothetical protein
MHIVIVNRWPRYEDARRWDNELTRYDQFIDHERHQISYVVDPPGARGVLVDRSRIASWTEVPDVNDFVALRDAVRYAQETVGPVDQLIALSEFTLEIAARVRAELGIPGPGPDEVAVYRDKVTMKEILAAAGVRVPRFARCVDIEQAQAFAADCGYPVIIKPVDGAGSIGVHRVEDADILIGLLDGVDLARHEVEEFVTGRVHHVDGYADQCGQVAFQVVSRYVNDCLSFGNGQPLGSVVLNGSRLRERIEEFTRTCVGVLGLREMPFHLELFVTADDDLIFLEIGGRVGGSEVPHLLNRAFGVNLYEIWLRAMGGDPVPLPAREGDPSGGWLVIPKPAELPARVISATSVRDRVPTVWRELVPAPGDVLEPGGSYDALHSGRFILLADREEQVEADICRILETFELEVVPA